MKKIFLLIFIILLQFSYSQKKNLNTKLISEKISIDGKFDEQSWKNAEVATDFVTFEPDNGTPITENKKTEVRVLYDNNAIYIGAMLNDDEPNKILKEFSQRDNLGTADFFGVFINGFNDGQQDFRFIVSASNTQVDVQANEGSGEDSSWDAVWESEVKLTDKGWQVEMKIPYAALRFSPSSKQIWGLNFMREVRRDRRKFTWNFVDRKFGTFIQQAGTLSGIENIKTPTRLFFLPYSSYYVTADAQNKTKGTLKGGLDIKYGINDAFTLDAVLIPDFGQAAQDQKILNLGPFEQQFNENRSFFTEGTDLFSKGNLFYSRRIGGSPTGKANLDSNEEFIKNPSVVGLLNATKISGRNKHGLGIGFLNAVTESTYASILNTLTNETRKELIEPLANYNVLVFDQRFNQNSSVSLINTNVTRNGSFRDGNVTALTWDLNTKANTFNLQGSSKASYVNENSKLTKGFNYNLELSKTSGKYRYGVGGDFMTKNFDNNDLGINFQTNFYSVYGNVSYRLLKANERFNRLSLNLENYYQFNLETNKPQEGELNSSLNIGTKKNNAYGISFEANPTTYDYYDPRVEGRFLIEPAKIGFGGYYSSNYNKKFAYDFFFKMKYADQTARYGYDLSISPRYRFSDKMSLVYRFNLNEKRNNKGYAKQIDTDLNPLTERDIIIGNRDVFSISNTITGKYSLSSTMNFNLSIYQYWSYSENKNFLLLNQDGTLSDYNNPITNVNSNFNNWNYDFNFVWWFAPGSQLKVLWRNTSSTFSRNIDKDFYRNTTGLLRNDVLQETFSVSVKYFLDYNSIKNIF